MDDGINISAYLLDISALSWELLPW
jgi:hypothetical protein